MTELKEKIRTKEAAKNKELFVFHSLRSKSWQRYELFQKGRLYEQFLKS